LRSGGRSVISAARNIKIVHEPNPNDEAFVRTRDAIAAAARGAFLGFGYAERNIERLQLAECMKQPTEVYLCEYGFTVQQEGLLIVPYFSAWNSRAPGTEHEDILQFFRKYPGLLR
jgi:hypothetical protein